MNQTHPITSDNTTVRPRDRVEIIDPNHDHFGNIFQVESAIENTLVLYHLVHPGTVRVNRSQVKPAPTLSQMQRRYR